MDEEQGASGNELLRRLAPADYDHLRPHMERVKLHFGAVLASAGDPIREVCFPEAAVVCFVDVLSDGSRLAVGLAGREGFVGWPLTLGNTRWPHEARVRAEGGTAIRMPGAILAAALEERPALRRLLSGYVASLVAQMARTIVSNLIHPVEARTARWILLYLDRIAHDEVELTHEELGIMLGVRRASITDALHQLEATGAIRGSRRRIQVRDRSILETMAGDTYGFAEAEYARLVRQQG